MVSYRTEEELGEQQLKKGTLMIQNNRDLLRCDCSCTVTVNLAS